MEVDPGYSSSPPVVYRYLYVRPSFRSEALTLRVTRTVWVRPPEGSGTSAAVIR